MIRFISKECVNSVFGDSKSSHQARGVAENLRVVNDIDYKDLEASKKLFAIYALSYLCLVMSQYKQKIVLQPLKYDTNFKTLFKLYYQPLTLLTTTSVVYFNEKTYSKLCNFKQFLLRN